MRYIIELNVESTSVVKKWRSAHLTGTDDQSCSNVVHDIDQQCSAFMYRRRHFRNVYSAHSKSGLDVTSGHVSWHLVAIKSFVNQLTSHHDTGHQQLANLHSSASHLLCNCPDYVPISIHAPRVSYKTSNKNTRPNQLKSSQLIRSKTRNRSKSKPLSFSAQHLHRSC